MSGVNGNSAVVPSPVEGELAYTTEERRSSLRTVVTSVKDLNLLKKHATLRNAQVIDTRNWISMRLDIPL